MSEHRLDHIGPREPRVRPPGVPLGEKPRTLGGPAAMIGLGLAWAAAFYGTHWIWTATGARPGALIELLATAFGGLWLFALVGGLMAWRQQPKSGVPLHAMAAVIGRIAQGDFRARVAVEDWAPDPDRQPYVHLAERLNDMAEDLGRIEALRQEFISNVSHEVRSPLTSIAGFARALRHQDMDPDTRARYLEIIEQEAGRLSRLSDNMLRLTALESENRVPVRAVYRLDRQLTRIVLAAEPQWTARQVEMEVDARPVSIDAHEDLMELVWVNLVDNALKFTEPGGTVRVRVFQDGPSAVVEVEDTGIGISPEDRQRVFERFFTADRTRGHGDSPSGSGLGLALAKKVVELHGGTITVSGGSGGGSLFRVVVPLGGADVCSP